MESKAPGAVVCGVKIMEFDPPRGFQDSMIEGPFRSFSHDHVFDACDSGTLVTDFVRFQPPVPVLGALLDRLVVGEYLRRFLLWRSIQAGADQKE